MNKNNEKLNEFKHTYLKENRIFVPEMAANNFDECVKELSEFVKSDIGAIAFKSICGGGDVTDEELQKFKEEFPPMAKKIGDAITLVREEMIRNGTYKNPEKIRCGNNCHSCKSCK